MRKRWSICLVLLAVILLFVGCSAPKEAETPQESLPSAVDLDDTGDTSFRPTLMYMADANGYLVPVMQQIPWEEGIAKATLSQIVVGAESAGAQKAGLTGILPKGTKVDLDISKDGVATVGLSKEALELKDALAEQNMIAGVVNTLLEFPTIKSVLIKVDGVTDGKLPHGTSIKEPFTEQKVNLENSQGVDVNTASTVQVYFQSESGLLVPTTALVDQNPSLTVALTRLTECRGYPAKRPARGHPAARCLHWRGRGHSQLLQRDGLHPRSGGRRRGGSPGRYPNRPAIPRGARGLHPRGGGGGVPL